MADRRQFLEVVFQQGLNEKVDDKVLEAPALSALLNGKFDKVGTINKRNGFTKFGNPDTTTVLGNTFATTAHQIDVRDTELVMFDGDFLWAFSTNLETVEIGWVRKERIPFAQIFKRRDIASHGYLSLEKPDVDSSNGYRCYVWQVEYDEDSAGAVIRPGLNVFLSLYDEVGNTTIYCDECLAGWASDAKVCEAGENLWIFFIRWKMKITIPAGTYTGNFNAELLDANGRFNTRVFAASSSSQDAVATGWATAISLESGYTATALANAITIASTLLKPDLTHTNTASASPLLTRAGTDKLLTISIETDNLDNGFLNLTEINDFNTAQALYDAMPVDGADDVIIYSIAGGDPDVGSLRIYNKEMVQQHTIDPGELVSEVVSVYANETDDNAVLVYRKPTSAIRVRIFDVDLAAEVANALLFDGSDTYRSVAATKFEDSGPTVRIAVVAEQEIQNNFLGGDTIQQRKVFYAKLNATTLVTIGKEQHTWNVRMGSRPKEIAGKLMCCLTYNEPVVRSASLNLAVGASEPVQGTAYLCDLQFNLIVDASPNTPEGYLPARIMARMGNFDIAGERELLDGQDPTPNVIDETNHLSDLRSSLVNGKEQWPAETYFWAQPYRTRIYNLPIINNTDVSTNRTFSNFGITSWVIGMHPAPPEHYQNATLGNVMYIGEGQVNDYDGCRVVENTFAYAPVILSIVSKSAAGALVPGAVHTWVLVWETTIGGRIYRSAPSLPVTATVQPGDDTMTVSIMPLNLTNKTSFDNLFATPPKAVMYRTLDSQSILFRTGSTKPDTRNGPPFIADPRDQGPYQIDDAVADSGISVNEILYAGPLGQNQLDNFPPPGAWDMTRHGNRLFLVGEDRTLLYFSKLFVPGLSTSFNPALTIRVDEGGDVFAVESMGDKLVVFKRSAMYVIYGEGPNNAGQGQAFSLPVKISSEVGTIHKRSVVHGPNGLLFFSERGFYRLSEGLRLDHIGARVFTQESGITQVAGAVHIEDEHIVLWQVDDGTNEFNLVWDYEVDAWSKWDANISGARGMADASGIVVIIDASADLFSQTAGFIDNVGIRIELTITTGWQHPAGSHGFMHVDNVYVLGKRLSALDLTCTIAYDYDDTDTETAEFLDADLSDPIRVRFNLTRKECTAIKITMTDNGGAQTGEGPSFTSIGFEYHAQPTPYLPPTADEKALV